MALLIELFRCLLVYVHLLFFGCAIALVFWADMRILRGEMKDSDYAYIGTVTLRLFIGLWITGLTIIFIDTGFDTAVLAKKPKLLTKLTCILVLSCNAIMLHKICLKLLIDKAAISLPQAITLSICGAISTSHWLMAAFVGSAKILGRLSLNTLLEVYVFILAIILLTGVAIAPHMQKRLNRQRSRSALYSVDLHLGDV
ncbi:MAG: hypothetical protein AB8B97_16725 [Granulosicoccus sp.]